MAVGPLQTFQIRTTQSLQPEGGNESITVINIGAVPAKDVVITAQYSDILEAKPPKLVDLTQWRFPLRKVFNSLH